MPGHTRPPAQCLRPVCPMLQDYLPASRYLPRDLPTALLRTPYILHIPFRRRQAVLRVEITPPVVSSVRDRLDPDRAVSSAPLDTRLLLLSNNPTVVASIDGLLLLSNDPTIFYFHRPSFTSAKLSNDPTVFYVYPTRLHLCPTILHIRPTVLHLRRNSASTSGE